VPKPFDVHLIIDNYATHRRSGSTLLLDGNARFDTGKNPATM